MIYNEIAKVISNNEIAENIYEAVLFSPKISHESKPGQFINILPSKDWGKVMRRPMSIASQNDGKISMIYKIFGEGTLIMSQWLIDETVDIIGPLGNSWRNYENKIPILIGGGVGIAPIMNFHNMLNELSIKHYLIMGARTKKEHFMKHNVNENIFLCTDNENYGIKGNIIVGLEQILTNNSNNDIKIFACGPSNMMRAVADYSLNYKIDCNLALETIMACGIGICQGCTVVKSSASGKNTYREKYALACIDGPIFNIKDLQYEFI